MGEFDNWEVPLLAALGLRVLSFLLLFGTLIISMLSIPIPEEGTIYFSILCFGNSVGISTGSSILAIGIVLAAFVLGAVSGAIPWRAKLLAVLAIDALALLILLVGLIWSLVDCGFRWGHLLIILGLITYIMLVVLRTYVNLEIRRLRKKLKISGADVLAQMKGNM